MASENTFESDLVAALIVRQKLIDGVCNLPDELVDQILGHFLVEDEQPLRDQNPAQVFARVFQKLSGFPEGLVKCGNRAYFEVNTLRFTAQVNQSVPALLEQRKPAIARVDLRFRPYIRRLEIDLMIIHGQYDLGEGCSCRSFHWTAIAAIKSQILSLIANLPNLRRLTVALEPWHTCLHAKTENLTDIKLALPHSDIDSQKILTRLADELIPFL